MRHAWSHWRWVTAVAVAAAAASLATPALRDALSSSIGTTVFCGLVITGALWVASPGYLTGAAAWLGLAVIGWSASLQLIDAPPKVAYQHYALGGTIPSQVALGACVLQAVILIAAGRGHLVALRDWFRSWRRPLALAIAAAAAIAVSAIPSRDPLVFAGEVVLSSTLQLIALATLVAAGRSVPEPAWERLDRWTDRLLGLPVGPRAGIDRWVLVVATAVVVLAGSLAWFTYQAHPHVPDEVAYLLHARYLAAGMLTMPLPPVPAGFNVDLMLYEPTRWFSPVPPGWPFVLAIGVKLGVPWLVNPVLGGVAILLAYLVASELVSGRTARLATLLLACSPWFLFMSMNLMTHTVSLVCCLGAALGVARARASGGWLPALVGGALAGALSLVRPLEGLVVAFLLGLWSLAARGRILRILPAAAFGAGVVTIGSLVRPYNAMLTGSPSVFPIMAYVNKYYAPGSNDLGFGANRGMGWPGLDPLPGHGPVDAVVNTMLNGAQVNIELLGWPVGAVALLAFGLVASWRRLRREDWWMLAVIGGLTGAHLFYWFSGGPDFGARYWYLIIVPCAVLLARMPERLPWPRDEERSRVAARVAAIALCGLSLVLYVPWRATGKYYHYRGMRPDVRYLARDRGFGRSLVLIRGARHPDYHSAAVYNPIDLHADAPVFAWDASEDIRAALLRAYPDRPVWILDGPSLTKGPFRVAAGPLSAQEALASRIRPDAGGSNVYDPVNPPRSGVR